MSDWKTIKGSGPWPFTRLPNKYAYLNNPRWLPIAVPFVKGGPHDYDGRLSQEPQVWTPPGNQVYSKNDQTTHHQCGHWHRPEDDGVAPPPPEILGERYQQSLDLFLTPSRRFIIFSGRFNSLTTIVVEGEIKTSTIEWVERMSYSSFQTDVPAPVRIVRDGSVNANMSYDMGLPLFGDPGHGPWMFRWRGDPFYGINLFPDYSSYPGWEEFDLRPDGVAIVLNGAPFYQLCRTDNFGATWSALYNIDYLFDLVGESVYEILFQIQNGFSIQLDEVTGIFYLLCAYWDASYLNTKWVVLKSMEGLVWDLVHEFDFGVVPINACSLAVSNDHIYVWIDGGTNTTCHHSIDAGFTWLSDTIPIPAQALRTISLSASGPVVLAYCPQIISPSTVFNKAVVMKSTDAGVTWEQTLEISYQDPLPLTFPEFGNIRSSGSWFAVTLCGAVSPLDGPGASWKQADEIVHDLEGDGQPYLCFWLSKDGGETWSIEQSPIPGVGFLPS